MPPLLLFLQDPPFLSPPRPALRPLPCFVQEAAVLSGEHTQLPLLLISIKSEQRKGLGEHLLGAGSTLGVFMLVHPSASQHIIIPILQRDLRNQATGPGSTIRSGRSSIRTRVCLVLKPTFFATQVVPRPSLWSIKRGTEGSACELGRAG